ncbi:S41 family peptidase [Sphingobacterium oryzagri]|uniref:S41 family peptidase n=1 Tax=Sphingobacterium oryzagri TaxID=3025669 RepID=A0ABY7WHU4_9SPHI|nr:S41 family peptidase [Sphingobacterium sp. KACC 22765]WDF69186.1 S41 family peptidase [Sphingobacterium sp. KACC 22765]
MDWSTARRLFLEEISEIKNQAELKPHFVKFLKKLKDHHSTISYMESEEGDELDVLERYANITYEQAGYPPLRFKSEFIDSAFAYINIPAVVLEQRKYVETIGNQLKALDDKQPKAWIFDLTENDGGSITPMLWQMYDLIDQDTIYSFVNRDGKEERQRKTMWDAEGDSAQQRLLDIFKLNHHELQHVKLKNTDVPIILLTSSKTASSGEFFVAAFKGQKNVIVIGQPTNGLTSGNSEYPLGKDYLLILTTDVLKDRLGKIYDIGEGIVPDLPLEINTEDLKLKKDDPAFKQIYIKAAIAYLTAKKSTE